MPTRVWFIIGAVGTFALLGFAVYIVLWIFTLAKMASSGP